MQKTAPGYSCKDPGSALHVLLAPQPGVFAGWLAGTVPSYWAVHLHCLFPALLSADIIHLGRT